MRNSSPPELIAKLEKLLNSKVRPRFNRYGVPIDGLMAPLKWKPLVLVIGNYSSGKSTLINELIGKDVQRVGQAPTDDCFTILSRTEKNSGEAEIPGSSVVSDERLPFGGLRCFGEKFFSHLRLKHVDSPFLENLALIDTPGMLDSVTERDRGYDYLSVIGELARLSDVIILMFDPHKAGTIKETYQAIRSTLPGSTGEDRVLYVLNRIDECANATDLLRSYGTLCWNLSQMTGRKDIPRIYMTFSDMGQQVTKIFDMWRPERDELKRSVENAPQLRLNHIFHEVDRGIREVTMQAEAYAAFRTGFFTRFRKVLRFSFLAGIGLFLTTDIFLNWGLGFPEQPLVTAIINQNLEYQHFLIPGGAVLLVVLLTSFVVQNILMPRYTRQTLAALDTLIPLETTYRKDLWRRVRDMVGQKIGNTPAQVAWMRHLGTKRTLERFLEKKLKPLFAKYIELRPAAPAASSRAPITPRPVPPATETGTLQERPSHPQEMPTEKTTPQKNIDTREKDE